MKHIHILGIAGTFMSGLALLAREAGFHVTGQDVNCYPPVSDLLAEKGIDFEKGYESSANALQADTVIVGNAMKRGMPVLEAVLAHRKEYTSGPQWLAEHVLSRYRVIAVSGTHGKTTTTSMLAHILEHAGFAPGFLIGGVAPNFGTNARLGKGEWFVIEADEYDSAFFDKRPKLMHYRPEIAIINNLEFDHADIYRDLSAIQQQFHYFLKTIPPQGHVLYANQSSAVMDVVAEGMYSNAHTMAVNAPAQWQAKLLDESGQHFEVCYKGQTLATVHWPLIGAFNVENGLAAIAASVQAGVSIERAALALAEFKPVKRRLEVKAEVRGMTIYDDFAHHPTAIANTIGALKHSQRHTRIIAVLELASYSMRSGMHQGKMADALAQADVAYILKPNTLELLAPGEQWHSCVQEFEDTAHLMDALLPCVKMGDAILVMSNRGFDNIHERLAKMLA